MSIRYAVAETVSTPDNPTIARTVVWDDGAIVRIVIAKDARPGLVPNDAGDIPFLRFSRDVRGGRVRCFVHTDQDLAGKKITARAIVMEREREDGSTSLYLDFIPVADDEPVTHRLTVVTHEPALGAGTDWRIFQTPEPLCGAIVFSEPDAKVNLTWQNPVEADHVVVPYRKPLPPIAAQKTTAKRTPDPDRDDQLKRLLSQGWEIADEDESSATLFRMKGDERKELIHRKPRKQVPKKFASKRR